MQPFQVRVYPVSARSTRIFFGLALCATGIFLTLLLLPGLFSIALCNGCFTWSSDGILPTEACLRTTATR